MNIKLPTKKQVRKSFSNLYDILYKDVSITSGLNSMVLISMMLVFLFFFVAGVHNSMFKSYSELTIIFGIIILLFCNVPFYTKGFFAITNSLLLIGGIIMLVNNNMNLMFWGIRLNAVFIAGQIIGYFLLKKKKNKKKRKRRKA